jgi:hypothetical protein
MKWSTVMSLYRQFTTTTYDRQNLSMVNTQATSRPELLLASASDYTAILNQVIESNEHSTESDNLSINALIYALTWMHRTYDEVLPGDNSLITNLYNFLMVPQLFMVTAVQLSNYTVSESGFQEQLGDFPLPDDMITTATGGWSNSRLVILPWTGYLFIAADVTLLLFVLGGIVWILLQPRPLHPSTGVDELDSLTFAETTCCENRPRKARGTADAESGGTADAEPGGTADAGPGGSSKDRLTLIKLAHNLVMSGNSSSWTPLKTLRGWRITVVKDTVQAEVQKTLDVTGERPHSLETAAKRPHSAEGTSEQPHSSEGPFSEYT